jgi:uncharacterized protein YydD (DUF2326 family)
VKLSRIYSNRSDIFQPIAFNDGFNVIYARVTKPKDSDKDSHNLGKTLLIHLIDFMLLKGFGKGHFLYDNRNIFQGYDFFLEVLANNGQAITVRRSVDRNTKISFKIHSERYQDFSGLQESDWDQWNMGIEAAQSYLNTLLLLTDIAPWDYRKGVSYFLRTQRDYLDVFQISKFAVGKHSFWKPYLAKVLGFNPDPVERKYELDDEIEKKTAFRLETEREFQTDASAYDRVKGTVEIKRGEITAIQERIDRFNFYEQEVAANTQVAEQIESDLSVLYDRRYTISYELVKIRESLQSGVSFDLKRVQQVFEESKISFPDQLAKSYEQLLEFNRRLSEERNRRLGERTIQLEKEQQTIEAQLQSLNERRASLLSFLQQQDTFAKFKVLQSDLVRRESEVSRLQAGLENLDVVAGISKQIRDLTAERDALVVEITEEVAKGNPRYSDIRNRFNRIIREVLDSPALLSISINKEGNFEFEAALLHDDTSMKATSEDKGTSYKKLLCGAFDMAVLESHARTDFYRFVYHDGILEGLDNRKKQKFLSVATGFCKKFGLQYIMTIIDADLPRDADDKKTIFPPQVIVRELHEGGDDGRLFKLPVF